VSTARDGLRLAVGTFTAVRVPAPVSVDAATVRAALLMVPLVGAVVGGAGGAVLEAVRAATHHSVAGVWLSAVAGIATVVALSRALHLDGLADTADGLGSGRPAEDALAVMRRSDIGPFGVVTVVLVLLVQVGAAAESVGRGTGWLGLLVAVTAGRTAVVWACRRGVPPARPDGLGRGFAGALGTGACVALTAVVALAGAGAAWLDDDRSWWLSLRGAVAVLLAAAVAVAVVRRCTHRLGGVTGDVMGAVVELGTTGALLCFALV
jgi:adenosylcobinamide-GDP ribazoletransferase